VLKNTYWFTMIKGLTIYPAMGIVYLISAIQPPLFHVLILIIILIISII